MKLIYIFNTHIPGRLAPAYQCVQMCEAFSKAGAEVTLLYRKQPSGEEEPPDLWEYYGVERLFDARQIGSLDLRPALRRSPRSIRRPLLRFADFLQALTFSIQAAWHLAAERDILIFSRTPLAVSFLAAVRPFQARRIFYEAHDFPRSITGILMRRWMAMRIGGIVAITEYIARRYREVGVSEERLLIEPGGFRADRFAIEGDKHHWRNRLGWPQEAFIFGYVGRFESWGEDKGLNTLIEALIEIARDPTDRPARLALIGSPERTISRLRKRLTGASLPEDLILYPGHIPGPEVPGYIRAFDVGVSPLPDSHRFAFYTSPLKLFEYMAAGTPIVATNLAATARIIRDGRNGLLVPPDDPGAMADALRQLRDDPALASRLAEQARRDVRERSWDARAGRILSWMKGLTGEHL
ncbi:MAG TPA: glycosyltransferase family 1 protein [Chloroflexi bacterium]|nr:glycosyltransferase family 1 protein [Chloroflexota bacterium]